MNSRLRSSKVQTPGPVSALRTLLTRFPPLPQHGPAPCWTHRRPGAGTSKRGSPESSHPTEGPVSVAPARAVAASGTQGAASLGPTTRPGRPPPRSSHCRSPPLGAAAGSPSAPPLRSKAALQEQWPGPLASRPPSLCVGAGVGGPAPPPAAPSRAPP